MIFTRLQARHFRSLEQVDQKLGRFQALVGPNASGKTTFLDVFGLLGDLMRYRGDIREAVGRRSADFFKLLWKGEGTSFQIAVEAQIPDEIRAVLQPERQHFDHVRYEIEVGFDVEANEIGLNHEALWLFAQHEETTVSTRTSFPEADGYLDSILGKHFLDEDFRGQPSLIRRSSDGNGAFFFTKDSVTVAFDFGPGRGALANVPLDKSSFGVALWFKNLLEDGVQHFVLDSQKIRHPSPPGSGHRFRTDGSNLPWVIEELRKDAKQFGRWRDHVRTAFEDIHDIRTIVRPEDRHRYLVVEYENGSVVPSWLVSDGTLRLLALTIPAYIKGLDGIFLIEEPENGIHSGAMETVIQSLESIYDGQVLIATHSPIVINQLDPEQIICFAKNSRGATDTITGDRHPRLRDWKKGKPALGLLAASGILS